VRRELRPILHALVSEERRTGLRFFERELVAAALGLPGDWFLLDRMLRAGVRFGYVEELVFDYYPTMG
jgi:hypothetical protein